MWFDKKHFPLEERKHKILLSNLHGYILPHAGTTYTQNILKHTLQFQPTKKILNKIKYILIMYLPAQSYPNVGKEFHEFFVLKKVLGLYFPNKQIVGYNVTNPKRKFNPKIYNKKNTLFILSVDFSHFLPLHQAIRKENCAAHSLMFQKHNMPCIDIVDDIRTFNKFYRLFPFTKEWIFQWIGRSRSPGEKGVGYLSFFIRNKPKLKLKTKNKQNKKAKTSMTKKMKIKQKTIRKFSKNKQNKKTKRRYSKNLQQNKLPIGFFVTAYDEEMNSRECLGNTKQWNKKLEQNLVNEVIQKANTTSRLTNGMFVGEIPVTNYTITYLYKEKKRQEFIRGYHAILKNALYLPGVFLENTYENGYWIKKTDIEWKSGNKFDLGETFNKLFNKSQRGGYKSKKKNYILFKTEVIHKYIE